MYWGGIDYEIDHLCAYLGKLNYLGFRLGIRAILGKKRRDELLAAGVYERFSRVLMFDRFGAKIPIGNRFLVFSPDSSKFLIPDDHLSRGFLHDIYFGRVYDRLSHPHAGNVVVDAGAHVGLYSIKASKLVGPEGRVLAIEPHPLNYTVLASNIRLNRIRNVEALYSALGDSDAYVKLHLAYSDSGSHSIMPHSIMPRSEDFVFVKVKRLDTVVREYRIHKIDFIKMDVEGAELLLLKGAEKTLEEFRPNLAIAAYHYPKEIDELSDYLRNFDYELYRLRQLYLYAVPRKGETHDENKR